MHDTLVVRGLERVGYLPGTVQHRFQRLGVDHKRLTFYFNGRNMRLTDVAGELIPQIVG